MSRKPYNGWTPAERTASGARARRKYASGEWTRPTRCCVCRTRNLLGVPVFDHLEDYSTDAQIEARRLANPHGIVGDPRPERIPLCYRCHMAIHTRFNNIDAFETYRDAVREGWQFPGLRANEWSRFQREHLRGPATSLRIRSGARLNRDEAMIWTFLDALMLFPINYKELLANGDARPPSMHPNPTVDPYIPQSVPIPLEMSGGDLAVIGNESGVAYTLDGIPISESEASAIAGYRASRTRQVEYTSMDDPTVRVLRA